jgi:uncharacterized protein YjbI with pentapeptide repeats
VDLEGANLTGVDLTSAKFSCVKLKGSNLTDAEFRLADITNTNFYYVASGDGGDPPQSWGEKNGLEKVNATDESKLQNNNKDFNWDEVCDLKIPLELEEAPP